jgi:hypothetical protein
MQREMFVIFDATPGADQHKPGMIAAPARRKNSPLHAKHFMHSGVRRIVRDSVEASNMDLVSRSVAFGLIDGGSVHAQLSAGNCPNVRLTVNA